MRTENFKEVALLFYLKGQPIFLEKQEAIILSSSNCVLLFQSCQVAYIKLNAVTPTLKGRGFVRGWFELEKVLRGLRELEEIGNL